METSWFIGSTEIVSDQAYTVDGAPFTVTAGSYYLYDASAPSLCDEIATALGGTVTLTEDGYVKIYKAGPNFTIVLPAYLEYMLGFQSAISGSNSYVADWRSPLFWSPGRVANSKAVQIGVNGRTVYNTIVGVGDDGTPCSTTHGSRTYNNFFMRYIDVSRIWSVGDQNLNYFDSGGTFERFRKEVLIKQYAFKVYRTMEEVSGSTDDASFVSTYKLGPYALTPKARTPDVAAERSNGFSLADTRWDIDLNVYVRTELT